MLLIPAIIILIGWLVIDVFPKEDNIAYDEFAGLLTLIESCRSLAALTVLEHDVERFRIRNKGRCCNIEELYTKLMKAIHKAWVENVERGLVK